MKYRVEKDSIGVKKVPVEAYYGVQSLRGHENFRISGLRLEEDFIKSLALVKKACSITNHKAGELDKLKNNAIVDACDKIIKGDFIEEFILDPIQGGAGTSMNMNMNEVLANIANEQLGYKKGEGYPVHPNDHVNMGQSTNDVIPSTGLITCHLLLKKGVEALETFRDALLEKGEEFKDIVKMGRTEMQDAVPVSLGSEFIAFSSVINRDVERLKICLDELLVLNLGGTAIGTGMNASDEYIKDVCGELKNLTNLNIRQAKNLIDSTQNLDLIAKVSSDLKVCALNLSKIAGDLILMSSGPRTGFGEITLPSKQNGSSIMPGKVNPVMPELLKQVAFQIMGNDTTVSLAVQSGQLELNAFYPIIFVNVFQSINILKNGVRAVTENCIKGIVANEERCKSLVENSIGIITAFAPSLGYEKAAYIAKKALSEDKSILEVIKNEVHLKENEIKETLDIDKMIKRIS